MFTIEISSLSDALLIFSLASVINLIFGEIPNRVHPTLWMGKIIDYFKPKLKNENSRIEKIYGVLLCLFLIILFAFPAFFVLFWVREFLGWLPYIVLSALALKTTFAIKCMTKYTLPVADAVEKEIMTELNSCCHLL